MYLSRSLGVASLIVASVQAAVSSTGFTVSLTDVDYFLPPKPVARISGCSELSASFEDAMFVPFTVVKAQGYGVDVAALTASSLKMTYGKRASWRRYTSRAANSSP